MNKETREQIEKDAKEYYETFGYTTAAHKLGYIAGATTQHPKSYNEAIESCIKDLEKHHASTGTGDDYSCGVANCINILCSKLEALKLDPKQA